MSRTVQEKEIERQGRVYRIKKFTPEVGCYWATRLLGDMMGMLGGGQGSFQSRLPKMIQDFTRMERKEFALFQRDCLSFVFAKFENSFHPLVNAEGFFTVTDVPTPVLFELTLHSFMFTISDFLDPSLLGDLLGAVPDHILEQGKNASETSSSPQSGLNTGNTMTSGMGNTPSPTSSTFST